MKFFVLIILLFLISCVYDPGDSFLYIVNRTSNDVYIVGERDVNELHRKPYELKTLMTGRIAVNDTMEVVQRGPNGWRRIFNDTKSGRIKLFIFNINSIETNKGDNPLIDKKSYELVSLTKDHLDSLNWVVELK